MRVKARGFRIPRIPSATLLVIFVLWLTPLFWVATGSVSTTTYGGRPSLSDWTLANWTALLSDGVLRALIGSVLVAAVVAVLAVTFAQVVVLVLILRIRPAVWTVLGLFSGKLIPVAVMLIPQVWFIRSVLGISSRAGVVVLHLLPATLLALLVLVPPTLSIRMRFFEESLLVGISPLEFSRKIALPQLSSFIGLAAVLAFAASWSDFSYASFLISHPDNRTLPVLAGQYLTAYETFWGQMYAVSLLSVIVGGLILAVFQYLLLRSSLFTETEAPMSWFWKTRSLLLLIGAFGLTACGGDWGDNQPLRIVVREGLEADGIERLARDWGNASGTQVEVIRLGRETYEVDVTSDILSAKPRYHVVFFPGTLVPEMAQARHLLPIDTTRIAEFGDIMTSTRYRNQVYGVPTDVSTFFMFYRSDSVTTLPSTWQEVLAFARVRGANSSYRLAFSGKAGEELPKMFYPILWSAGGFIVRNDSVGLDTPEGIAAATLFRDLAGAPGTPPDIENWDVVKVLDEVQSGRVLVAAPQWNALYPLIRGGESPFATRIEAAPLPAFAGRNRVSFAQSWMLVKSKSAPERAANEFIAYAVSPEGARTYAAVANGNPARASVLSDTSLIRRRPEFPLLLQSLRDAQTEPAVPYYAEMHQIMNDHLSALIAGRAEPEAAMRAAATELRRLIQSRATSE